MISQLLLPLFGLLGGLLTLFVQNMPSSVIDVFSALSVFVFPNLPGSQDIGITWNRSVSEEGDLHNGPLLTLFLQGRGVKIDLAESVNDGTMLNISVPIENMAALSPHVTMAQRQQGVVETAPYLNHLHTFYQANRERLRFPPVEIFQCMTPLSDDIDEACTEAIAKRNAEAPPPTAMLAFATSSTNLVLELTDMYLLPSNQSLVLRAFVPFNWKFVPEGIPHEHQTPENRHYHFALAGGASIRTHQSRHWIDEILAMHQRKEDEAFMLTVKVCF